MLRKVLIAPPSASPEEKRKSQRERAVRFGVEALEGQGENLSFPSGWPTKLSDYGDPVNLKYPLIPDARARNARARFKQFASSYRRVASRRIVHTRIVRKLLSIGAKPSYNPEDPLDRLLPSDLKARLQRKSSRVGGKAMQDKIEINKVELVEGEELMELVDKVYKALAQNKAKTDKSLGLRGIFKDYIITRDAESGQFFQMAITRKGEHLELGEPVQVRQIYVPVAAPKSEGEEKVEKLESQLELRELAGISVILESGKLTPGSVEALELIAKAADSAAASQFIDPPKEDLWAGVL